MAQYSAPTAKAWRDKKGPVSEKLYTELASVASDTGALATSLSAKAAWNQYIYPICPHEASITLSAHTVSQFQFSTNSVILGVGFYQTVAATDPWTVQLKSGTTSLATFSFLGSVSQLTSASPYAGTWSSAQTVSFVVATVGTTKPEQTQFNLLCKTV